MARTQDQQRWRSNTCRKRIEVYLPPDVVDRLDALATERGQKRPAVIAALIDSAAPAAEAAPEPAADTAAETNAPPPSEIQAIEASTHSDPKGYKTRRPRSADEKRYDWIVVTNDGQRIALGPDPARFWRWCGRYLDGSIFSREAKGNTLDEIAQRLIDSPELYR
jgi:hypothetical protein